MGKCPDSNVLGPIEGNVSVTVYDYFFKYTVFIGYRRVYMFSKTNGNTLTKINTF